MISRSIHCIGKKGAIALAMIALTASVGAWAHWRPAKAFVPSTPQTHQLRVVTWNVGYFAPVSDKNLRDIDIPQVAETIAMMEPDIVVLQELGHTDQAESIAKKLGEEWWQHAVPTGHGNQAIAILGTSELIKIESFECGGRMSLGATLKSDTGKAIYVCGIHSPHPARGIQENKESIEQSIQHTHKQDEAIRIVTGDMNYNFDPGSPDEFYQSITTHFGDGTIDLGETYYAQTRIDHVFHYPKNLVVDVDQSGLVDLPMRFAKVPGFRDHRPIVVTYNLD